MKLIFNFGSNELRMIMKGVCELRTWSYIENEFLLKNEENRRTW